MKNKLIPLFLCLATFACQAPTQQAINVNNEWSQKMREMATSVNALLPYVYDKAKFENKENLPLVASYIRIFEKNVRNLPIEKGKKSLGADPLMRFSLKRLKGDLSAASEGYSARQFDYSRSVLKSTINHCFNCHTRNDKGVKYSFWNMNVRDLDIPINEKAELFIATRQYEKAAMLLKQGLKSQLDSYYKTPYLREKTIKQLLIVLVRAENDPQKALVDLDEVLKSHEVPAYLMQYVETWKTSLKYWAKNKKDTRGFRPNMARVLRLNARAQKIVKTQPVDAAFVEYLQMSSRLHKMLIDVKSDSQKQKVFYYLGLSYQALKDSGFWELPEVYFEACVRAKKKTKLSKSCFQQYKAELLMGFTGSAGTFLPSPERKKLNELKKISGF